MLYINIVVVEVIIFRSTFQQFLVDPQNFFVLALNSQRRFPAVIQASHGNTAHPGPVFLRSLEQKN